MLTPKMQEGQENLVKPVGESLVNEGKNPADSAKAQIVRETQALRTQVANLTKSNSELNERVKSMTKLVADADQIKSRAIAAEDSLENLKDGGLDKLRISRKFEILKSLLMGAAAGGQLFGNHVKAIELEKALKHYLGVAEVVEREALKRGF